MLRDGAMVGTGRKSPRVRILNGTQKEGPAILQCVE